MTGIHVLSDVRARRAAAELSQAELAERVGVSRQALGAIEAGKQVPSTALALQLARALRCRVDDLFRLPGGPVVEAVLADSELTTRRVVVGRVDGDLVAHPADDHAHAADGVLVRQGAPGALASVELLGDEADIEANVLVAGCAPLLGAISDRLARRYKDARATWVAANSARALSLLERSLVHVAGIHLGGDADPAAHERAARRVAGTGDVHLVNLARWRQGLVVARGNPRGVTEGADLLRQGLRWVTREPGAGAQALLERTLIAAGSASGTPSQVVAMATSHAEVARLVRWGLADVGVAIEAAALAEGLDFVPLSEERFDLVVPGPRLVSPAVQRFVDVIDSPAFRAETAELPGYDLSQAGHVSTVAREGGQ